MTINGTSIDDYILQDIVTGFEYRNGDEGYTANGSHYQNIIAKKSILTIKFRPLTLEEYQTIETMFYSTDEYIVVLDINGTTETKTFYRGKTFSGTNVGDNIIKGITIELKEI